MAIITVKDTNQTALTENSTRGRIDLPNTAATVTEVDLQGASIESMVRVGDDLVIELSTGKKIVLEDYFFDLAGDLKHKLLVDSGEGLVDFNLADATAPTTNPVVTEGAASGLGSGAGLSGLAGLVGIGAAAAAAGGGSSSTNSTQVSSESPLQAPTVASITATNLSGSAVPGATVFIDLDGDGESDLSAPVNEAGEWEVEGTFEHGDELIVSQTLAEGTESSLDTVVVDLEAPEAPTIDPTSGEVITGTGEPGATVTVVIEGVEEPLIALVNSEGTWSVDPVEALPHATNIAALQVDPAGNESEEAEGQTDSQPPLPPEVEPTNGQVITGTAEPFATVEVSIPNQAPFSVEANEIGEWSYTPETAPIDGVIISATQTDAAGNTSDPAEETVDGIAPEAPSVDPTNGDDVTGEGEPFATITITYEGLEEPLTANVTEGGTWELTSSTLIPHGTVLAVTQTDPAGNTSEIENETVDGEPPAAPVIDPTQGDVITGMGEAGTTLSLQIEGFEVPFVTVVGEDGTWSVDPAPDSSEILPHGTELSANLTDVAGNVSEDGAGQTDSVPPSAPVIDPTDGTEITGTAEPDALVSLQIEGQGLVTVLANESGEWSYMPPVQLANETGLLATQSDPAGNVSDFGTGQTDSVAPEAPEFNPSSAVNISGTGEPGATVSVSFAGLQEPMTALVDADGNWTIDPADIADGIVDGTLLIATQVDPAGNESPFTTEAVDATAPQPFTVDPTNGTEISGTGEPGATVEISWPGLPEPIMLVVGETGEFSVPVDPQLPHETIVEVTQVDPAGNASEPAISIEVDTEAPDAPIIDPTDGIEVMGTGEPGATVTVTYPGQPGPLAALVNGEGNWSVTPPEALADGTIVAATQTDPAGNESGITTEEVDAASPAAPTIDPTDGTELSGAGEPGATVLITYEGLEEPLTAIVDPETGEWSIEDLSIPEGTELVATQIDPVGNESDPATETVDSEAPEIPAFEASANTATGTGEPGATVEVRDPEGEIVGTAVVDEDGNWTAELEPEAEDGDELTATQTDAAGNASDEADATVDDEAPDAPEFTTSATRAVGDGGDEPGATINVFAPDGETVIGTAVVDEDGDWAADLDPAFADGNELTATATDAVGNESAPASTTIDDAAPEVPVFVATSTSATGTVDIDDEDVPFDLTVNLYAADGTILLGTAEVDEDGNWQIDIDPALADGVELTATTTDAVGNVSGPGEATVDAIAPVITIDPLVTGLDTVLTGTGEANGTIELTIPGSEEPIEVDVDGDGNWSYTPEEPFEEGDEVSATQTDASGNVGSADETLQLDKDGDGVANTVDIDDDNDGILDVNETDLGLVSVDWTSGGGGSAAGNIINLDTDPQETVGQITVTTGTDINGSAIFTGRDYDGSEGTNEVPRVADVPQEGVSIATNINGVVSTVTPSVTIINPTFLILTLDSVTYDFSATELSGIEIVDINTGTTVDIDGSIVTFDASPENGGSIAIRLTGEFGPDNPIEWLGTSSTNVINAGDALNGATQVLQILTEADLADADGDGVADRLDTDSDNGGVSDNVEAQYGQNYVAPSGEDADGDGLDDAYDDNLEGAEDSVGLIPNDAVYDYDPDIGELPLTIDEALTSGLLGTGLPGATITISTDADGDLGTAEVDEDGNWSFDVAEADPVTVSEDETLTATQEHPDFEGATGVATADAVLDTDFDGVIDTIDVDDDNDGIIDDNEAQLISEQLSSLDNENYLNGIFQYTGGFSFLTGPDVDGRVVESIRWRLQSGTGEPEETSILVNGVRSNNVIVDEAGIYEFTFDTEAQDPISGNTAIDLAGRGSTIQRMILRDTFDTDTGMNTITPFLIGNSTQANIEAIEVNLVSGTLDTDDDGIINALDTDSDGGGIGDNIEAQYWQDYVAPSGEDVDGDGLDDAYDDNLEGAEDSVGLIPNDAVYDYDPDAGELPLTIDEALTSGLSGTGLPGATITISTDADGDLGTAEVDEDGNWSFDIAEADPITVADGEELTATQTHPDFEGATGVATVETAADTDGDGVGDSVDIDDDNDGILDVNEDTGTIDVQRMENPTANAGADTGSTTIESGGQTIGVGVEGLDGADLGNPAANGNGTDESFTFLENFGGIIRATFDAPVTELKLDFATFASGTSVGDFTVMLVDGTELSNLSFDVGTSIPMPVGNSTVLMQEVVDENDIRTLQDATGGTDGGAVQGGASITFPTLTPQIIIAGGGIESVSMEVFPRAGQSTAAFEISASSFVASDYDTDDDGIINSLDIDSDNAANDGASDNVEAQHGQDYVAPLFDVDGNPVDVDNDGLNDAYDDNLEGADDSIGLVPADADGNSIIDAYETANSSDIDTDGDGIFNHVDIDDDGDGLLDAYEDSYVELPLDSLDEIEVVSGFTDLNGNPLTPRFLGNLGYGSTNPNGTALWMSNGIADGSGTAVYSGVVDVPLDTSRIAESAETTFSIYVGKHPFYAVGNYSITLVADGVAVGTLTGTAPTTNNFEQHTLTMSLTAEQLSGDLAIRLDVPRNANPVANRFGYVHFDDVTYGALTSDDNDNNGTPNSLQVDSDAGGIGDNIEAQYQNETYVAPSDVDVDRDGLDDAYDQNLSGADGSIGLIADDLDNNGTLDFAEAPDDTDTLPLSVNPLFDGSVISGTGVVGATVTLTDGDDNPIGDPVIVGEDGTWSITPDTPIAAGTELTATLSDADHLPGETATATQTVDLDTDGDGVVDSVDIDDDNDGILDVDEGGLVEVPLINGSFEDPGDIGVADAGGASATRVGLDGWTIEAGNVDVTSGATRVTDGIRSLDLTGFSEGTISQNVATVAGQTYSLTFDFGANLGNGPGTAEMAVEAFDVDTTSQIISTEFASSQNDLVPGSITFVATGATTEIQFRTISLAGAPNGGNWLDNVELFTEGDTDGDGIVDRLDTDSDDGGASDTIEAQHGQTLIEVPRDEDGNLIDFVDADGDGLHDAYDADDDDTSVEASIGLGLTDADNNGTTDFLESANGSDIDTDGDGVYNHIDIDDDNDGILDVDEMPAIGEFSTASASTVLDVHLFFDHNNMEQGANGQPFTFPGGLEGNAIPDDVITDASATIEYGAVLGATAESVATSIPAANMNYASAQEALDAGAAVTLNFTTTDNPDRVLALSDIGVRGGWNFEGNLAIAVNGEIVADLVLTDPTATTSIELPDGPYAVENGAANTVEFIPYNYTGGLTDVRLDSFGLLFDSAEIVNGIADNDVDGDGIVNSLDLDSDGNGIDDIVENGGTDANGDGLLDALAGPVDGLSLDGYNLVHQQTFGSPERVASIGAPSGYQSLASLTANAGNDIAFRTDNPLNAIEDGELSRVGFGFRDVGTGVGTTVTLTVLNVSSGEIAIGTHTLTGSEVATTRTYFNLDQSISFEQGDILHFDFSADGDVGGTRFVGGYGANNTGTDRGWDYLGGGQTPHPDAELWVETPHVVQTYSSDGDTILVDIGDSDAANASVINEVPSAWVERSPLEDTDQDDTPDFADTVFDLTLANEADLEGNVTEDAGDADIIAFAGAVVELDLTAVDNGVFSNVTTVDMTEQGSNSLTLILSDLVDLSADSDALFVRGDAGDSVNALGNFASNGTTTVSGVTYNVYSDSGASLFVEEDVSVNLI